MVSRARSVPPNAKSHSGFIDLTERDAGKGFGMLGVSDDRLVEQALLVLKSRLRTADVVLTSPVAVRDYLRLRLADLEHEVFVTLWLNSQRRLIAADELFRGTLSQTSVYPREVVKAALRHNAAAVIFAHNHPSGIAEPSRADELLTQSLKSALALVDVRVLDHFVVGGSSTISFAERGIL
jgi:DNA repair protein RadC